ncbi:hypothetical protein CVT24_000314 [Panaeolus cyanescens]|uniref:Ketoreductase (KR) domain-containing protein n=1 Tax=Panaeolus cyanescens TaxID=181874 RepID=A0A409YCX0_9AGAR|nr:hypothetical protein CVT24_000314 [Panaeolus cyanescens]
MFSSTLSSIQACNRVFVSSHLFRTSTSAGASSRLPTAVFVGGTSGIGEGLARVFARDTDGQSNIIIVGRNRKAAEKIFESLPRPTNTSSESQPSRDFIECDASLIKHVQTATSEILQKYSKINYLLLTPGYLTLEGLNPTSEGIDKKLAVHYYARWKFANDLLPALKKAKEAGEEAKVLSVLGAGIGAEADAEDFGLKKEGNYTLSNVALVSATYNDLMMQKLSLLNSSIAFLHSTPGVVRTNALAASPSARLRLVNCLMPLAAPFMTTPEECASYQWHGIYTTSKTEEGQDAGAWRIGSKGEDLKKTR